MPVTINLSQGSPLTADTTQGILEGLAPADIALKDVLPNLQNEINKNPQNSFNELSDWPEGNLPSVLRSKCGFVQAIMLAHHLKYHLRISPADILLNIKVQTVLCKSNTADKSERPIHECQKESTSRPHRNAPGCKIPKITLLGNKEDYVAMQLTIWTKFDELNSVLNARSPPGEAPPPRAYHDIMYLQFMFRMYQIATLMIKTFDGGDNEQVIKVWKQMIGGGESSPLFGWFPVFGLFDQRGNPLTNPYKIDYVAETQEQGDRFLTTIGGWHLKESIGVLSQALPDGFWRFVVSNLPEPEMPDDDAITIRPETLKGAPGVAFLHTKADGKLGQGGHNTVQAFTVNFVLENKDSRVAIPGM